MKKRKKYESQILWGVTAMLVVAFYFLILRWSMVKGGFDRLKGILMPIIIGFVVAFLLDSLVEMLNKGLIFLDKSGRHEKACRALSIFLSEALMINAIAFLVSIILPDLISSVMGLIANAGGYMEAAMNSLEPLLANSPELEQQLATFYENISQMVQDFLNNDVMTLVLQVTDQVRNIGSTLYNFIIGIIVSIYFLAARDRLLGILKKLIYTFFPINVANASVEAGRVMVSMFKGFFVGKIWDSIIVGIICFIGLTILKMPYALLVSIVVGVTNIIPYFGPFIGAIPSALLILVVDPKKCLIFLIFILILQQVDGNLIGPKVLGNQIGVSSLGVLFSILVGGGLFGVVGMLVCVPTYAFLCWLIGGFCEDSLGRKGLPVRASDYVYIDSLSLPEQEGPEEAEAALEEPAASAGESLAAPEEKPDPAPASKPQQKSAGASSKKRRNR